jgi:hypothetical protein
MVRTELPRAAEQTSLTVPGRVSPLRPDDTPVEVHSVSMGGNLYVYARRLIEADRKAYRPDRRYLIERGDEKTTLSAEEILELAASAEKR